MKDEQAESLLAKIMQWNPEKLSSERFRIQLLADLKYDDYQQYSQGMRYMESLALWLRNFDEDDRSDMYEFIKNHLIYISEQQMRSLIEGVYPYHITPILLDKTKSIITEQKERSIQTNTDLYSKLVKAALFLGLSDGSHIDVFRRANPELNNEQISVYYDLSEERLSEMLDAAREGCADNSIFLLDDFSGSGISYIRKEDNIWKGKIIRFIEQLKRYRTHVSDIDVHVILYISTKSAIDYINTQLNIYLSENNVPKSCTARAVQMIQPFECDEKFTMLLIKYYSRFSMKVIESSHYKKGGENNPYMGFAGGRLPIVLFHNTPNNAFPIIWFNPDDTLYNYRGLFPRVTRHKEED